MLTAWQTMQNLSAELLNLNLGSGEHPLREWLNVDLSGADLDVDLGKYPWPWQDETVCQIVASHILEHFSKEGAYQFLLECWRILAPGGAIHIAVPDMDKFVDCKLNGDWTPLNGYVWTDFNWFFGGDLSEPRPEQRHSYMYNFETLYYMLDRVGFDRAERRGRMDFDTPRYEAISLYVTAVKG